MIDIPVREEMLKNINEFIHGEVSLNFCNLKFYEKMNEISNLYCDLFLSFLVMSAKAANLSPMEIFEGIEFLPHLENVSNNFIKYKKENQR